VGIGAIPIPYGIAMLTPLDLRILDFERGWFLHPEPKDRTISEVLGMSPDEYYARLRELMDVPAALEYDPLTIRRLRRLVGAA
jgi:hypothetical protein